MRIIITYVLIWGAIIACNVEPAPINYGADTCEYCHMTIVDRQHAAEIVTAKGRIYTFDAIECLVNYLKTIDQTEIAHTLINDYQVPGELIDAISATYLISENIQSPMGANLSGTARKEDAQKLQHENGGTLYTWNELINYFEGTQGVAED